MTLEQNIRTLLKEIIADILKETASRQTQSIQKTLSESPSLSNPYFTIKQAAKYVGCSDKTLRKWIAEGRIKAVRISERFWRVRKSDLDALGIAPSSVDTASIANDITADILKVLR